MKQVLQISRIILIELVLILVLISGSAEASHFMGSDLTWKCIGKDSFIVTFTFYRDCNGIPMHTISLITKCKSSGNLLGTYNITIPKGIDITPNTNGNSNCGSGEIKGDNRCKNSFSAFPYGIEQYVFQTLLILSNAGSCCEILIYYENCCRNNIITTGMANEYYNINATLNRCLDPCDNSPTFTNPPMAILCLNQDFVFNNGIIEEDHDSLSFEMTSPLGENGDALEYFYPYDYDKPLSFWGFPNKNLSFPRGFHLSPVTGDLSFRPMKIEASVLAVKISEFRNGVKIGEIRRDIQIIVMACTQNNPPSLSGPFYKEVCATNTVCFTIATYDPDPKDTLKISYDGAIPGAIWTDNNCKAKHPTGSLCWTPGEEYASPVPYIFTVTVVDDAAPIRGTQTRAYQILVKPLPKADIFVIDSGCANYWFFAQGLQGRDFEFEWIGNFNPGFYFKGAGMHYHFKKPGAYPYTLRVTSLGCDRFYFDTIFVDTFLQVNINGPEDVCIGEKITLGAASLFNQGSVSFKWSTGETDTSDLISIIIDKDTTVSLLISDSSACFATDTIFIKAHPLPIPDLGSDQYLCKGASINLKAGYDADSQAINLVTWWDKNNVQIGSGDTISLHDSGKYYCFLEDSFGCHGIDSLSVFFNPELNAFAENITICRGQNALLEATTTGSRTSNVQYTWFNGNDLLSNNQILDIAPDSTTSLLLKVSELLNGTLCTDSSFVKTIVNSLPEIDLPAGLHFCIDQPTIHLKDFAVVKPFSSVLTWESNSKGLILNDKFNPTLAEAGDHSIYLSAQDPATKCINTDSMHIIIYPLPEVSAGNNDSLCKSSGLVELKGEPSGITGFWNSSAANTLSKSDGKWFFNPASAGIEYGSMIRLIYYFIDEKGCASSDTALFTVFEPPEVNAGVDLQLCKNHPAIQLSGTPEGGYWTGKGVFNGVFIPSLVNPGVIKATYHYSTGVCESKDEKLITVYPLPEVNAKTKEGDTVFCSSGLPVELTGMPEGGMWSGNGVFDKYFDPSASMGSDRMFLLTYQFRDTNGCENKAPLLLYVKAMPEADIIPDSAKICIGEKFNAKATYINAKGVEWFLDSTTASGDVLTHSNTEYLVYTPSNEDHERGYFKVHVKTIYHSGVCSPGFDSVRIKIAPKPEISFSATPLEGCEPLFIQFFDQSSIKEGMIRTYEWDFGDGVQSSLNNPEHTFYKSGLYTIRLKAISEDGCPAEMIKHNYIRVYQQPLARFIPEPESATIASPLIFFKNNSDNLTSKTKFNWNFGDPAVMGGGNSALPHPFHRYSDTGIYTVNLYVINEYGCTDSFKRQIEILPDILIYIPSAFSPDQRGPEENEVFRVEAEGFSEFNIKVFSRWGELLYESDDYTNHGWNGYYYDSKEKVPAGVYICLIQMKSKTGKEYHFSGSVTLLK